MSRKNEQLRAPAFSKFPEGPSGQQSARKPFLAPQLPPGLWGAANSSTGVSLLVQHHQRFPRSNVGWSGKLLEINQLF